MLARSSFYLILVCFLVSCTSAQVSNIERNTASTPVIESIDQEVPSIKYFQFEGDDLVLKSSYGIESWLAARPGDKLSFLQKIWSANYKGYSKEGTRHYACYVGAGQRVAGEFFNRNNVKHRVLNVKENVPASKASYDGSLISLTFTENIFQGNVKKSESIRAFQVEHCSAGKNSIGFEIAIEREANEGTRAESTARSFPGATLPTARAIPAAPVTVETLKHGWALTDTAKPAPGSELLPSLPTFEIKADYDRALHRTTDNIPNGFDISNQKGARKFAVFIQKYVYEGMIHATNRDLDFIPKTNTKRYWCHMPWLNVGPVGREAIHGLTKERDLGKSPTMSLYKEVEPGTDWGMAVYNAKGCQKIGDVFGTPMRPNPKLLEEMTPTPKKQIRFPDGTVTAKILFTSSPTKTFADAYTWNANISGVGVNERFVQPVKHIQMDVLVRATNVIGTNPDTLNWIMLTYYFDPSFDLEKDYRSLDRAAGPSFTFPELAKLPEGLKKMRPMGVQTGFEPADSLIFSDAETNGPLGRLNGPADNPKSSCLSCHGTAGTRIPMSPGIMENKKFLELNNLHLDFSQQLTLAKKNFETYVKELDAKPAE